MKKRKAAHFLAGPYLPVTENWIYEQLRNLRGYEPVVYCYWTENLDAFGGIKVRSLRAGGGSANPWTLLNLAADRVFCFNPLVASFIRRDTPHVLHAHFGPAGYALLGQKRAFGLPLVTTFYGYDLTQLPTRKPGWKKRYARLFERGDAFLVEGSHMRERLVELGCPREKAHVRHIGVDMETIGARERAPDETGSMNVLVAATFKEKKGIPYAVEAFGRVARAHPGRRLALTIIGDSTGTVETETTKKLILEKIDKLGIGDLVNMMGYQGRAVFLEELYRNHIFLSPSVTAADGDTEGGAPVSIIEAAASGMPVLSTFHCDIPEVVLDGETGYLVPERDVDALAERLDHLLENPGEWAEMGNRARRHIAAEYDARELGARLEEIYDGVAGCG